MITLRLDAAHSISPLFIMRRNPVVYALVGEKVGAQLRTSWPDAHFCRSWEELAQAVRADSEAVAVVDPCVSDDSPARATRLSECFRSTPFIIYTALEPKSFQKIVQLIRAGFTDVVILGYDDQHGRLERLLEEARLRAKVPAFIEALASRLELLPRALRSAIEEMIREPRRYRAVHDLAAAAQMSTRAVFRHLKAAGFSSPRRLLAASRAMRAYQLLRGRERSAQEIARRLGYSSADQLSCHLNELAGVTASEVKKGIPEQQFTDAIVASLTRPASIQVEADSEGLLA